MLKFLHYCYVTLMLPPSVTGVIAQQVALHSPDSIATCHLHLPPAPATCHPKNISDEKPTKHI